MLGDEGSRSELLRMLAELGEEPAFLARGRAPEIALNTLLRSCEAKREELLEWPKFHLSALARRVSGDWSRLAVLFADPASATALEAMHVSMPSEKIAATSWPTSDRASVLRFVESALRFNCKWQSHIDQIDLEPVNRPRREFNQFYMIEMACALENQRLAGGIEPLQMLDHAELHRRFPPITIPEMA